MYDGLVPIGLLLDGDVTGKGEAKPIIHVCWTAAFREVLCWSIAKTSGGRPGMLDENDIVIEKMRTSV